MCLLLLSIASFYRKKIRYQWLKLHTHRVVVVVLELWTLNYVADL